MNPMDLADFKFLDKLEASHQAPCSLSYPSKTKLRISTLVFCIGYKMLSCFTKLEQNDNFQIKL